MKFAAIHFAPPFAFGFYNDYNLLESCDKVGDALIVPLVIGYLVLVFDVCVYFKKNQEIGRLYRSPAYGMGLFYVALSVAAEYGRNLVPRSWQQQV